MKDLKEIRTKINKIDEQMAKLFEERMNASKEVASYKISHPRPRRVRRPSPSWTRN